MEIRPTAGVQVVVPHLPASLSEGAALLAQQQLVRWMQSAYGIEQPILWFYTPMALPLADGIVASVTAYDCMDDLSGFAHAPAAMKHAETALLNKADIVFTGGRSLYEDRRKRHHNVHAFPSSVDVSHFAKARAITEDPVDQRDIPHPRLGFCGVIDERMDLGLVREIAERNPLCHLVMLGPTAKIEPADLPRLPNIHYLGMKSYEQLPSYFSGWDVALMPFAHNSATRFISPTKTPEYLAAGLPVVSTSIRDVVHPYGETGCVAIADGPDAFSRAIARALTAEGAESVRRALPLLLRKSWDTTFQAMEELLLQAGSARKRRRMPVEPPVTQAFAKAIQTQRYDV